MKLQLPNFNGSTDAETSRRSLCKKNSGTKPVLQSKSMTKSLWDPGVSACERLKDWLQSLVDKWSGLEWSTLTRTRRVDVMVGLTLHCLLLSLHVLLLFFARASRFALIIINTVLIQTVTLFGIVRPLRLLRDSREVRQQLESATVLRVAGFSLVLFEGLRK